MEDIQRWIVRISPDSEVLDRNIRYINSLIYENKINRSSLQYDERGEQLIGVKFLEINPKGYVVQQKHKSYRKSY